MTCPAVLVLAASAMGFKKEYELGCKRAVGHKGPHEPTLPHNVTLSGEGSWAIKVKFGKPAKAPTTAGTAACKCGRQWAHEVSDICG